MKKWKMSSAKNSRSRFSLSKKLLVETVALQTPRGRLIVAALTHIALLLAPYRWLTNLSLYKLIGLNWVPSIGLTRAYWLLLHGDLAAAWQQNWLIFPVLAAMWSIVGLDVYKFCGKARVQTSYSSTT